MKNEFQLNMILLFSHMGSNPLFYFWVFFQEQYYVSNFSFFILNKVSLV